MNAFPSLFLSHGAPTLIMQDCPATRFLSGLGDTLGRPSAVLCVSAHWETPVPQINGAARLNTIHDFFGFPAPLYEERYDVPGDPGLAARVAVALSAAGIEAEVDLERGIDHGAWVPLKLMYPAADIPVLQLSIGTGRDTAYHRDLGAALHTLRDEGVLIVGSGSATHNLRAFRGQPLAAEPEPQAADFQAWLANAVAQGDTDGLLNYRDRHPHAAWNHPTEDHIMPLFAAMGAARDPNGAVLHQSVTHAVLAMDAYRFS